METEKARERRKREGFFRDFIRPDLKGIDIGCGDDPVTDSCIRWDKMASPFPVMVDPGLDPDQMDFRPGKVFYREKTDPCVTVTRIGLDAMRIDLPDASLDWVYSSHCLEDLDNPWAAVKEWWRVLKQGGFMCIMVPHRDLFECRKTLPSAGNSNHRTFWLPDRNEAPVTLGLAPLVASVCQDSELMYCKTCDEGYQVRFQPFKGDAGVIQVIATGEFSIEAVWRRRLPMQYVEDMLLPEWFQGGTIIDAPKMGGGLNHEDRPC